MSQTAYDSRSHATLDHEYWFQETSGALVDQVASDNGTNDANVVQNVSSPAPPFSPGDAGACYQYPTNDGHTGFAWSTFDENEQQAIEMIIRWAAWSDSLGWTWLLGYRDGGTSSNFKVFVEDDGTIQTRLQRNGTGVDLETASGTLSLDTWYHLVLVCGSDPSTDVKLYLDGDDITLSSATLVTGANPDNNATLNIANPNASGANGLDGYITRLRLYQTDVTNTTLPDATFWGDHHDDITAGASSGRALIERAYRDSFAAEERGMVLV